MSSPKVVGEPAVDGWPEPAMWKATSQAVEPLLGATEDRNSAPDCALPMGSERAAPQGNCLSGLAGLAQVGKEQQADADLNPADEEEEEMLRAAHFLNPGPSLSQLTPRSRAACRQVSCSSEASQMTDETEMGIEVWLHVYDLGPVTGRLNEIVLRGANLGAFHCGVEVLGEEWSFQGFHDAWDDPTLCGIVYNEPRLHPAYPYKETVPLGKTMLDEEAITIVLDSLMDEWPACEYHVVAKNCVTFAEEFTKALDVPGPFPTWVKGAIDACKTPALEAITNYGWSWFRWWSKKQMEQEALAEAEAHAAANGITASGTAAHQLSGRNTPGRNTQDLADRKSVV